MQNQTLAIIEKLIYRIMEKIHIVFNKQIITLRHRVMYQRNPEITK